MAATPAPPLPPVAPIDLGLLTSLPTLPLRARYLVECFMTGKHHSPFEGTAPEFAEYRAYEAGDEIRHIDWRLYGRSDRLVVKQFEDESQLRVCLALDLSASMRYASRKDLLTKFDFARTILAAVTLLARRQHDAVGLALLGETSAPADGGLCDYLRPGTSPAHHSGLFNRLENPPDARKVALASALHRVGSLMPRGSLIVMASDFYANLEEIDGALHFLRSRRIELIGFQVLDPMEIDFDADLAGRFVDLEEGGTLLLNSAACRAGYLERFSRFRRELAERFRSHEAGLALQRTDANPLSALAAYLAERGHLV